MSGAGGGEQDGSFAVLVLREPAGWQVTQLPDLLVDDLPALVGAVRQQAGVGDAFVLVDVAEEFFVAVRVAHGQEQLLLSDITAADSWDLAEQVLDRLGIPVPTGDDLDEVWPAGDLGMFDDLGLDAMELGAILSDVDAYADEMLSALARRLGFAPAFEQAVDALV